MLVDQFNRKINYIRVSVTDRCDFRCVYCMSEKMTFIPKNDLLSLEQIARVIRIFTSLGVEKVRIGRDTRSCLRGTFGSPRRRFLGDTCVCAGF